MSVTVEQIKKSVETMDLTAERTINDGSGTPGTFQLLDAIAGNNCMCDTICTWINEKYENDEYDFTTDDIVEYITELYPIV